LPRSPFERWINPLSDPSTMLCSALLPNFFRQRYHKQSGL
jgi:hypothetical protein